MPAHPRSRGENGWGGASTASRGSSPLTRGKPQQSNGYGNLFRLIPAHAGKTVLGCRWKPRTQAHPRSRGENHVTRAQRHTRMGSSPLTRGKRRLRLGSGVGLRLIPAHAGKTKYRYVRPAPGAAHPRSRGENASQRAALDGPRGSSPLTRGKPLCEQGGGGGVGLIPAHAGKTCRPLCSSPATTAHPRSRGENFVLPRQPWPVVGSSPLTRGKPRRGWMISGCQGLIPAHAEKTRRRAG